MAIDETLTSNTQTSSMTLNTNYYYRARVSGDFGGGTAKVRTKSPKDGTFISIGSNREFTSAGQVVIDAKKGDEVDVDLSGAGTGTDAPSLKVVVESLGPQRAV